ncbi:LysR family transcriptional regulator [Paracoccus versutus]|uniref:LysR family transcriptional regulator n=1 Tax=Paracoccus versutus TaxID=34007 RepID=UPI0023D898A1|nr:LysR family transcriptional regulator [Paracoccus versutus]
MEHGSFSAAAGGLGVRESAISRRIRDLEDETGAALFICHKRGVTLTDAGKRFLSHARRALDEIDLAIKDGGGTDARRRCLCRLRRAPAPDRGRR